MIPDGFDTRLLERIEVLLGDRGPAAEPRRALRVSDKDAMRAEFLPRDIFSATPAAPVAMAAAGTWVEAMRLALPYGTWAVDCTITVARTSAATLDLAARLADAVGAVIHASAAACAPLAANRSQTLFLTALIRNPEPQALRQIVAQAALVAGSPTDTTVANTLPGITGSGRATIIRAWRIE